MGDRKVPPVRQDDSKSSLEVIIKISPWAPPDEVAAIREKLGATLLETTKSLKMELWSVPENVLPSLIVMDGRSDLIEYVELNNLIRVPPIGGGRADVGHRKLLSTGEMTNEHADVEVGASMVATPGAHSGFAVTNTGLDGDHSSLDWDFLV